ncbi:MAG: M48 family metalloprotease [Candidatus Polarisedimenticolia bacterium]
MRPLFLVCAAAMCLAAPAVSLPAEGKSVKLNGYLEYRKASFLVVEGQRVSTDEKTRFTGTGRAKSLDKTPMGYEMKVKGIRREDGTVLAREIEAVPNRTGSSEQELLAATDSVENAYVKAGKVYEQGQDGKELLIGKLHDSGPQVERARRIVGRVLPAYVPREKVSVYVVDNKEWNAMAMPNYSIYVFSQLMADMDDDEVAIVLGHEIAHATYEHSRRQQKTGMIGGLAGAAAGLGASAIDNPLARQAVEMGASLGVTTFGNTFSREYEDQADRVGLRYVYEAGYDYTKAPKLWRKFADKYGDQDKITNFFFGDHSTSVRRASDLEQQIAHNYADPKKDPPVNPGK